MIQERPILSKRVFFVYSPSTLESALIAKSAQISPCLSELTSLLVYSTLMTSIFHPEMFLFFQFLPLSPTRSLLHLIVQAFYQSSLNVRDRLPVLFCVHICFISQRTLRLTVHIKRTLIASFYRVWGLRDVFINHVTIVILCGNPAWASKGPC